MTEYVCLVVVSEHDPAVVEGFGRTTSSHSPDLGAVEDRGGAEDGEALHHAHVNTLRPARARERPPLQQGRWVHAQHPSASSVSGVGRCQQVCVCVCVCVCREGGGGGHTDTYMYVPSVKNQFKRDVTGYMVIYVTAICVSLLKFSTR